jgi:putative ABC transport system permease protein
MVLAIVLLAGAGLMIRSFSVLTDPLPGMQPDKIHTFRIALRGVKYEKPDQVHAFASRLLPMLEALPGAESAALAGNIPYSGGRSSSGVTIEHRPEPPPGELFVAQIEAVTPGFHRTLRIPLSKGRSFQRGDGREAPLVCIVNETFAARQFPKEDPLGKRVKVGTFGAKAPWMTIVGVAGDVRQNNTDRAVRAVLYRPLEQAPARSMYAVIRASGDPASLAAPARGAVHSIDASQPVFAALSYRSVIDHHMTGISYVTYTMAIAGALALVLSVVGVYGVMAYSVTERTHEIGVRMALGAARADVQWHVVRSGLALTGIGLMIGLALAWGLARLLSGLIFAVSATDATAFVGVSLLLAVAATLACWIPARRASRVDPMTALRND